MAAGAERASAQALPLQRPAPDPTLTASPSREDSSVTLPLLAGTAALALFWTATLIVVLRRRVAQRA